MIERNTGFAAIALWIIAALLVALLYKLW